MTSTKTLCTLNANGIRAAERRGFSDWIERSQPDYLCLQEMRARPEQVTDAVRSPAGYNSRWLVAEKKGYSGVGLYTRTAVESYQEGCGLDWADAEGRVLRAEIDGLTIISTYVPSGSSSEERLALKFEFMKHFPSFTKKFAKQKHPVVICGDVNIAHTELDIHAPKRNEKNSGFLPEERAWLTDLMKQGWKDVVRAQHPEEVGLYSWWSARGKAREKDLGWRLDYVLGNAAFSKRVRNAWIDKEADLSDHAPVWVEFEAP